MDYAKILAAFKFAPHVLLGVALASGVVLLGPSSFTSSLGLDAILSTHRSWIGVGFLLSTSIFVSSIGAKFVKLIGPAILDKWKTRQRRKGLHCLTPPEKAKLAEYLRNTSSTRSFHMSDGVVCGLVGKGILYVASSFGHPGGFSFPFNLQPWAWEYLVKHPELVAENNPPQEGGK